MAERQVLGTGRRADGIRLDEAKRIERSGERPFAELPGGREATDVGERGQLSRERQ
jgi:hypothetical protein